MKKIRLTESDLENIVRRVISEQEEIDTEMDVEDNDDSIMVSLDHIAMLLKDGECSCSGQKLVLDLEGGEYDDYDDYDDDDDDDDDEI